MNSGHSNQFKKHNKFNDKIPFIIYLIFTIIYTGFLYSITLKGKNFEFEKPPIFLIFVLLSSLTITISTMILIFVLCASFALRVSFFLIPGLACFSALLYGDFVALLFALFSGLLGIAIYFMVYRDRIDYSAEMLKTSTLIILEYLPLLLIIAASFVSFILGILYLIILNLNNDPNMLKILFATTIFYFYWNFSNCLYTFRVLVSSIVAYIAFGTQTGYFTIFIDSFKNTLFCLGSISLAGLLIAIISTCRALIQQRNNRERMGIFTTIVNYIILMIVMILEDIVNFANEWVCVYMAIYGNSYKKSMKEAYNELMRDRNTLLIDNLAIQPLLTLLGFGGYLLYAVLFATSLENDLTKWRTGSILSMLFFSIFYFYMVNFLVAIFDSASKALLYVYNKDKTGIQNKYPDAYNAIEKIKSL